MAQNGATLYYISKNSFDFERVYGYLAKLGFSLKHPDTQLITSIDNLSTTSQQKIQELIYTRDNFGIDLWLENKQTMLWSFVVKESYFFQSFGFNSLLDYDQIENEISQIFIQLALLELSNLDRQFLGFTLDQFGSTEWVSVEEVFESKKGGGIDSRSLPEISIFYKKILKKIAIEDQDKIIKINQNFDCIAKDKKLSDFLESLL